MSLSIDPVREERNYLQNNLLGSNREFDEIRMELEVAWNEYLEQKHNLEKEYGLKIKKLGVRFETLRDSQRKSDHVI